MKTKNIWLAFGDIHEAPESLKNIPELKDARGLIVTGDITNASGVNTAQKILKPLLETGKKLIAQPGNMDDPKISDWLDSQGYNLHRQIKNLDTGLPCLGLGFSTFTPFKTPGEFSEEDFSIWLAETIEKEPKLKNKEAGQWLFISHQPPINTKCDKLTNGISVGSKAVRDFIEKYQPTYCICGHIHESAAVDTIGKTIIINPGTLPEGGYVLIHEYIENDSPKVEAQIKNFKLKA